MDEPVFLYYELHNYYQNHRLYLNSRSMDQLAGEDVSETDTDARGFELKTICEDVLDIKDMDRTDWAISQFEDDDLANPCGFIARSVFNDTFALSGHTVHEDDISWPADKDNVYARLDDDNWSKNQWLDVDNEHV